MKMKHAYIYKSMVFGGRGPLSQFVDDHPCNLVEPECTH